MATPRPGSSRSSSYSPLFFEDKSLFVLLHYQRMKILHAFPLSSQYFFHDYVFFSDISKLGGQQELGKNVVWLLEKSV